MRYYPGEKQFIEDTLLVEKLAMMDAALTKEAGALSDMLGGVGNSIQNFAKENVDTSSPKALLSSLGNIMAPAILFNIYKPFGILLSISSALGFNASAVVSAIKNFVTNSLAQGKRPTPEEITNIGMGAVSSQVGGAGVTASGDMFDILKQAEREGSLIKMAQRRGLMSEQVSGPMFMSNQHRGVLGRVFGGLTRQRGKWLLGGFLVWIIKKLLAGAGLLALAGAGVSLMKGKDKVPATAPAPTTAPVPTPEVVPAPVPAKPQFVWSGRGGQQHPNNNQSIWYVPMQNIFRTMLGWTIDVYPEVGLRSVAAAPSFQQLVGELQGLREPGTPYIRIPSRFKTRKQVVDSFIQDISA